MKTAGNGAGPPGFPASNERATLSAPTLAVGTYIIRMQDARTAKFFVP